jgi:transcriptional regulator with XRE-family HTH domain
MKLRGNNMLQRSELTTLKSLRRYLVKNGEHVKARRFSPVNAELRGRLDETVLAFRVARKTALEGKTPEDTGSWLRAVRQAAGIPVYVMAERLGVTKHEIFRLEKAEQESRIVLANLRRGAIALGCELVYALVPREGSLEDLAAAEKADREAACTMAAAEEEKKVKRVEEFIDWRGAVRRRMRKDLRKMGLRVR